MLARFEKEALENSISDDDSYHESHSLNRLLKIFQESVRWISERSCNHYLFSDNICITIDYVVEESEQASLFLEIMQLVNLLSYEFIKEGYFIRGGIDAGWFLDSRDMAAGVPLLEAYRLESKVAIHPRVVVSKNFLELLKALRESGAFSQDDEYILDKILIEEEGISYVNGLLYIQTFEDSAGKAEFLTLYREKICSGLTRFSEDERVGPKYRWIAQRFDSFLVEYIQGQAEYELSGIWKEEELLAIKDLKIN
jgi:hypothetical protein